MRKIASLAGCVTVAVVMVWGATAYACTNLAALNLSTPTGKVGDSLTVTGSSFQAAKAGAAPLPVVFRWNALEGPVVAQALPDAAGNVSANFSIPEGQPGYYVVVARQQDDKGKDQFGTPARASFQVLVPGGQPVAQPAAPRTPLATAPASSSSGMLALTVGVGVLGLVLFAAAFKAFVGQSRRRDVPVAAPVHKD